MSDSNGSVRIAMLLPDLRPGGAERLHVNLAKEWLHRGVTVEFVLRQARGQLLHLLPEGATVVDLNARRVRDVLRPLVAYLKHSPPDVLLAAMWPLTVVAPLAARLAGYSGRVAISEHSPLSRAYRARGRTHAVALRASTHLGYRLADARIGVSGGVADDMAGLSGMRRDRFEVIHNPAALGLASSSGSERPSALGGVTGPLILTVGTLKPVKRHDLLIEAFAVLPVELGATLCILGEGHMREALRAQVDALGLAGRVLLPGFVADPAPWYAHADLFVLSSDYEGFGNVIVEAMEYGLPIVSTDCPAGPAEILEYGRFGSLVPTSDAPALAAAMQAALMTPVDGEALRERARAFDVGTIAARYLEVLLPAQARESGA